MIKISNKLTEMAREILAIEADLPYRLNYNINAKADRPYVDDFELYTFIQVWGSTSLGFNGIGGQAMTEARTYVFVPLIENQKCFVYFAGRFAYSVEYSDTFINDVRDGRMVPVSMSGKYKGHKI